MPATRSSRFSVRTKRVQLVQIHARRRPVSWPQKGASKALFPAVPTHLSLHPFHISGAQRSSLSVNNHNTSQQAAPHSSSQPSTLTALSTDGSSLLMQACICKQLCSSATASKTCISTSPPLVRFRSKLLLKVRLSSKSCGVQ